MFCFFFFQAEDGIRDGTVTGVQTCALPIYSRSRCDGAPGAAIAQVERVVEQTSGCSAGRPRRDTGRDEHDERELLHLPSRPTTAGVPPRSAGTASSSGRAASNSIA